MGAGRYRRMVWRPGCGVRRPCARLGRTNVEGEGEREGKGGMPRRGSGRESRVGGWRVGGARSRSRCFWVCLVPGSLWRRARGGIKVGREEFGESARLLVVHPRGGALARALQSSSSRSLHGDSPVVPPPPYNRCTWPSRRVPSKQQHSRSDRASAPSLPHVPTQARVVLTGRHPKQTFPASDTTMHLQVSSGRASRQRRRRRTAFEGSRQRVDARKRTREGGADGVAGR